MATNVPPSSEASVTSLVSGIIHDAEELIKQQAALLKHDIRAEIRQTKEALTSLALGGAIMGLGMFLLTNLGIGTTRLTSALFYVVLGLGMGFLMQMVSLIAQNSVQQRDMGVASSARMFFQQIGGSLGVAAFGAVFARKLTESLASAAGTGVHISASGGQLDPATVNSLPAQVKHDVFFAIAHAVQSVFIWALPAAVLIFVLALFIKEVPLRGRIAPPEAGETASQQAELVS